MQIKGLIHIHSNFSDGELSLEEIKKQAKEYGAQFVLMADHFSFIATEEKFNEFKRECDFLSDKNFLLIPGFEVEPEENFHILVYNTREFIAPKLSLEEKLEILSNQNTVLVLAHASQIKQVPSEEILEKLNGVEVWNARYDSRHAPNLRALKLAKKNELVPFGGADAHSSLTLNKIWLEIENENFSMQELMASLKTGRFKIVNKMFSIDLKKSLNLLQYFLFGLVNLSFPLLRKFFRFFIKRGIKIPNFLKRIFHKFY